MICFKISHSEFHHADMSIICDVIFALVVVVSILLAFCLFCYWVAHTAVPIILFCDVFFAVLVINEAFLFIDIGDIFY